MGNNCVRARLSVQSISSICFDGRSQSKGLNVESKEEESKSEAPFSVQETPPKPVVIVKDWGDDGNNNKPSKPKSREVTVIEKVEEKIVTESKGEEVAVYSKPPVEDPKPGKVVAKPADRGNGSSKKAKVARTVKRMASAGLKVESILKTRTGHLKEWFTLGRKLGNGQFGTTFLCVEKGSGKEYACKSIAKRKLLSMEDVEDVRREIEIMHHLSGNPNIISIKGAYEDNVAVHVVMELCTGGELFDRIVKRGHYSEKEAASITRTIVSVIQTCHSLGVMHRDLKPENFLFVDGEEDSAIKSIDFGLSTFFKPGEIFHDVVGSPYYVAPEVLRKKYGIEADIWSAGVIVYIMLCGVPPFWGESEKDIFDEVLHGNLDFALEPWPKISEEAKDLVRRMLIRDPKKRLTAHEVLCHPWVQVDGVAPDKPLGSAVFSRLTQFRAMNKFKKMALRVIAERLSEEEIAGLKQTFKMLDTDNSGQITFEELKAGLKMLGANLEESEIHDLMRAADVDNNGTIDYGEFIAATLHLNKIEKEDNLYAAFQYFDKDGSGYITIDELQRACEELGMQESHLEEIIKEADQNDDGCIDYTEFVAMMHKGSSLPDFGRQQMGSDIGSVGFRKAMQVC